MLLSHLLKPWTTIPADYDPDITNLTLDSRTVTANDGFVAVQGLHANGEKYVADAIKRGARFILLEKHAHHTGAYMHDDVLHVPLSNLSALLPQLAERFYQVTGSGMQLMGVTGTNGKTSCTHFLADIYQQAGIPCGIIGTLGCGFYGALLPHAHTTPDIFTLYRELSRLKQQGAKKVAMEVSSHSIHQKRIAGLPFATGIFTNLTQDHLDYHGSMENYAAVKYQFLADTQVKKLVVNAQDAYGRKWCESLIKDHEVLAFGRQQDVAGLKVPQSLYVSDAVFSAQGIEATVHTQNTHGSLTLPLLGEFNLSNALAVLATLLLDGWTLKEALPYFKQLKSVPGRVQVMGGGDQPLVVIDYAHTPDALEKVLLSLKHHVKHRLICVFGCGGDRDRGKRPQMGRIASMLADRVILTNDNPRSEVPEAIIEDILQGISDKQSVISILDRSNAIENGIQYAKSGDIVLIAGKGAERFQYIGDEVIPFLDEEEVRRQLGSPYN